jgi:hypothetical protein
VCVCSVGHCCGLWRHGDEDSRGLAGVIVCMMSVCVCVVYCWALHYGDIEDKDSRGLAGVIVCVMSVFLLINQSPSQGRYRKPRRIDAYVMSVCVHTEESCCALPAHSLTVIQEVYHCSVWRPHLYVCMYVCMYLCMFEVCSRVAPCQPVCVSYYHISMLLRKPGGLGFLNHHFHGHT